MDVSNPAGVLIPGGTAAVLRALAGADTDFTVRQVARIAGVSHTRAQQVILRLAEHGLVLTEDKGPSKLCRLNRRHLAAGPVTELVWLRSAMIDLLRNEIASWSTQPVHASLFGSAARGDGGTASDLDILIIRSSDVAADDDAWGDQLTAGSERIRAATGNDVAWFDISPEDLEHALKADEPLIAGWRRDAIHLVGAELRVLLRTPA